MLLTIMEFYEENNIAKEFFCKKNEKTRESFAARLYHFHAIFLEFYIINHLRPNLESIFHRHTENQLQK